MSATNEQTTELDFTAAFDRLAELGDNPVPSNILDPEPVTEGGAPAAGDGTAAPADEGTPAGEESTEEGEGAAAVDPAPAPEGAPTLTADEMLARLAEEVAARVPTPKAEPKPEPTPEPAATEPAPVWTPEEQQQLTRYMDEWPDVAQNEALIRRGEYKMVIQHVMDQVRQMLQPVEQTVSTLAAETQYQQLQQAIPEYDTLDINAINAWVAEQPSYLQPGYKYVIERGTPDEVKHFVAMYRQSTGAAPATPAPVSAPPATPKKEEPALPTAVKQATGSLAPVSSKRSAVASTIDASDFDSAFETAAKTL